MAAFATHYVQHNLGNCADIGLTFEALATHTDTSLTEESESDVLAFVFFFTAVLSLHPCCLRVTVVYATQIRQRGHEQRVAPCFSGEKTTMLEQISMKYGEKEII